MYAIAHAGRAYGPDGVIRDTTGVPLATEDVDDFNRQLEAQVIEHLKSGPERLFLYVEKGRITTWMGLVLDARPYLGREMRDNFGGRRRSVDCRIFGVRYMGWYYCSAGNYCRLKRAKRQ